MFYVFLHTFGIFHPENLGEKGPPTFDLQRFFVVIFVGDFFSDFFPWDDWTGILGFTLPETNIAPEDDWKLEC